MKYILKNKLEQIDELAEFLKNNPLPSAFLHSLEEDFKLDYTYNSNAIEGNTLTLKETKVVLEGVAIGGKTLKEHFEAINHAEAIDFIKNIIKDKEPLSQTQIKSIHKLILKNINDKNAGVYRNTNVRISGAKHTPPHFTQIQSQMDNFLQWYEKEAMLLHPVIRASRVHINFVKIHPFIDGNGRSARLLMNLELLKANLLAINIKNEKKLEYYEALDKAHCNGDCLDFDNLVADYVLKSLEYRKELILKEKKGFKLCKMNTMNMI